MGKASQNHINQRNNKQQYLRFFLWLFIAAYVASLPYAIIIFKFLEQRLTLAVIKTIPVVFISFCGILFVYRCHKNQNKYHIKGSLLPSIFLLLSVLLLESNSIKYLHIPQFFALTCFIYCFLKVDKNNENVVLASFVYASLLGLIDEVHHGIHPERYYGWKDMYINTVGSGIGALFLNTLITQNRIKLRSLYQVFLIYRYRSILLLTSLACGIYSLYLLFDAAQYLSILPSYPVSLFTINLIIVGLSSYQAICAYRKSTNDRNFELVLYWPTFILMVLHGLIVYTFISQIKFI